MMEGIIFMTAIHYPDLVAWSPSRNFRCEATSPHNLPEWHPNRVVSPTELGWPGAFQKDFEFTLHEGTSDDVRWTLPQAQVFGSHPTRSTSRSPAPGSTRPRSTHPASPRSPARRAATGLTSGPRACSVTYVSSTAILRLNELFPAQGMRILQEALSREVGPWLLGYADPLRERVEARQREAAGE